MNPWWRSRALRWPPYGHPKDACWCYVAPPGFTGYGFAGVVAPPRVHQRLRATGCETLLAVEGGELAGQPGGRGAGRPGCRERPAPASSFLFWHDQRLVQCRGRAADVERVHKQRVLAKFVGRAGLARQDERTAPVGQDRALFGDQVHAIPDGIDEQHVREPVAGQGSGVVIAAAQQDGRPVRRGELVLDPPGLPLHARRVLAVL